MKKFLLIFLAFNVLAVLGLCVFIFATGRLDSTKVGVIMDLLHQPSSPPDLRKKVAEALNPPSSAPAGTPSTGPATQQGTPQLPPAPPSSTDSSAGVATASDRIEFARQAIERERLKLDRDTQDLQHRQELLEVQRRQLDTKLAEIQAKEKEFESRMQVSQSKSKGENFTRSLAFYQDLKPKQVKDLFMNLAPDLVADYLKALESDQATRIVSEFKSPEERAFISGVLERIRVAGTLPASTLPAAATAPGAP